MPKPLIWGAAIVVGGFGALYLWSRFFSSKPESPGYTMGKATGAGVGFMDTSKAQSGVTPETGDGKGKSIKLTNGKAWTGRFLAVKSTMPTINPVPVQAKEIFWSERTAPSNKRSWS